MSNNLTLRFFLLQIYSILLNFKIKSFFYHFPFLSIIHIQSCIDCVEYSQHTNMYNTNRTPIDFGNFTTNFKLYYVIFNSIQKMTFILFILFNVRTIGNIPRLALMDYFQQKKMYCRKEMFTIVHQYHGLSSSMCHMCQPHVLWWRLFLIKSITSLRINGQCNVMMNAMVRHVRARS